MAELINKNKLLEDIYNNNPQDLMKYIAEYHKCKQGEWIPVNDAWMPLPEPYIESEDIE